MRYFFLLLLTLSIFSCKEETAKVQTNEVNQPNSSGVHENRNQPSGAQPANMGGNSNVVTAEDRASHDRIKSPSEKLKMKEELAKNATKGESHKSAASNKIALSDEAPLPNACQFVSKEWLEDYFDLSAGSISVKNGSNPKIPYANGCFFRWDDHGTINSGVMVQIQRNPVPEEYADWIKTFISNKKTEGETAFGGTPGEKTLYKDFPGVGDEGAYTFEGGKYYWRKGTYIYMVAFNLSLKEKAQYKAAQDIATVVMKNF